MKNHLFLSEALAYVIETTRKERAMTKTALADFADMQPCYLREILKGKKKPTVNTIFAICGALQIEPGEFFSKVAERIKEMEGEE